jgi:hypothetical protein
VAMRTASSSSTMTITGLADIRVAFKIMLHAYGTPACGEYPDDAPGRTRMESYRGLPGCFQCLSITGNYRIEPKSKTKV